jgi:hypothetical protein
MNLHVSRLLDNSPVRDAQVSVVVRGREYAATAQVDGGYTLSTPDLTLPGPAALEFRVTQGGTQESLRATLQSAGAPARRRPKRHAAVRLVGPEFRGLHRRARALQPPQEKRR